jgi:hypothetical protein
LEAAVDSFSVACSEFQLKDKSARLFRKYGFALRTLREELSMSPETKIVELSCAIYLLMLVQVRGSMKALPTNTDPTIVMGLDIGRRGG